MPVVCARAASGGRQGHCSHAATEVEPYSLCQCQMFGLAAQSASRGRRGEDVMAEAGWMDGCCSNAASLLCFYSVSVLRHSTGPLIAACHTHSSLILRKPH